MTKPKTFGLEQPVSEDGIEGVMKRLKASSEKLENFIQEIERQRRDERGSPAVVFWD